MTTKTTHTPGPWIIENSDIIQKMGNAHIGSFNQCLDSESEANARLIASAPELLSICKKFVGCLSVEDPLHKHLLNAIAKAEGTL